MSAAKTKRVGKRYSSDEKKKIVEFVASHDAEKGRGGKSAAVKKFGISPISLATWIKNLGEATPSVGKKRGRKPGSKNLKTVAASGSSLLQKLQELSQLAKEIEEKETELARMQQRFSALKSAL